MLINPPNPQLQTEIFSLLFFSVILFTLKKSPPEFNLTKNMTEELKGVSILMILFGHIGYFLSLNHNFLYPLSVSSGVGVNLFLFLSGFGLTKSSIHNKLSILDYYKKRIPKLFLPLWIILTIFYIADFFILNKSYSLTNMIQSYLGFFPQSDIYTGLNSSLWYFTVIIFYYLMFPLIYYSGTVKYLSPLILFLVPNWFLNLNLPVSESTLNLYKLHDIAFPLGVFFAMLNLYFHKTFHIHKFDFIKNYYNFTKIFNYKIISYFVILVSLITFAYFSYYSGVGTDKHLEQITSIFLMMILVAIFLIKGIKIKFLGFYGKYSYGIYLIHWPILFRYDLIYKFFPAFLATFLYLFVFLIISKFINKLTTSWSSTGEKFL